MACAFARDDALPFSIYSSSFSSVNIAYSLISLRLLSKVDSYTHIPASVVWVVFFSVLFLPVSVQTKKMVVSIFKIRSTSIASCIHRQSFSPSSSIKMDFSLADDRSITIAMVYQHNTYR